MAYPQDEEGDTGFGSASLRTENQNGQTNLVRIRKVVDVLPDVPGPIDTGVVSPSLYNAFNYSILGDLRATARLVIGVVSPNPGEGKTLVTANLAVALSTVYERDSVVVDLNIATPNLHRIFGTRREPGLLESLVEPTVRVHETRLRHLYVLPAGNIRSNPVVLSKVADKGPSRVSAISNFGLDHLAEFRDVVYSLRERFEFVLVDMPSAREPSVPLLLTHQMDGVLVVIDANKTKLEDVEHMFRTVHENHVLGFVFNRAGEDNLDHGMSE